jgi:hypothetical protein
MRARFRRDDKAARADLHARQTAHLVGGASALVTFIWVLFCVAP